MSFVKATMRVIINDYSDADYYVEEAAKIDVDEDDDEAEMSMKELKMAFLDRARDLDAEDLPNVDELFCYLRGDRHLDMIRDIVCWNHFSSPKIYIEGEDVMVSFVADFNECKDYFGESEIEALEDLWNEEPFYKSRTGGHVGNYCNVPSRKNFDDKLCELTVDLRLVYVSDESGETEIDPFEEESDIEDLDHLSDIEEEEESSEEEGQVKHPFFVTHESLFGSKDVDLDSIESSAKKPTWSKRFVPKPIRAIFKRVH
jgi:hypothetical protein